MLAHCTDRRCEWTYNGLGQSKEDGQRKKRGKGGVLKKPEPWKGRDVVFVRRNSFSCCLEPGCRYCLYKAPTDMSASSHHVVVKICLLRASCPNHLLPFLPNRLLFQTFTSHGRVRLTSLPLFAPREREIIKIIIIETMGCFFHGKGKEGGKCAGGRGAHVFLCPGQGRGPV